MKDSPIYTLVKNNCAIDKTLNWAGGKTIYVEAGGTTEVPFDVWSVSSPGQQESIRAELSEGTIALTVCVYDGNDYVSTAFLPYDSNGEAAVVVQEPAFVPETKASAVLEAMVEEDKAFNIVAKTATTEHNRDYYAAKSEGPAQPIEEQKGDSSEKGDEVAAETVEEKPVEGTPQERFDALCASKHWSEALAVLKEVYGDKVTFGSRALMQTKTWAATVEKYSLEA